MKLDENRMRPAVAVKPRNEYSWRSLTDTLSTLSEEKVLELIETERSEGRRWTIIHRLHQRYTVLRANRERDALLAEINRK